MSHIPWLVRCGLARSADRQTSAVVGNARKTLVSLVAASLLVTVVGVGGLGIVADPAAAETPGCPEKMIFQLGGRGDPDAAVFNGTNANLPAGVQHTPVKYSASFAPYPGDTVAADTSVAEGEANMLAAVRDFHGRCPDSKIAVAGYSEGALAGGNALEKLAQDASIPHDLVEGVLYSDGQGPTGLATVLTKLIPGLADVPGLPVSGKEPDFGDLNVKRICNSDDLVCNAPDPLQDPVKFIQGIVGYLTPGGPHQSYGFDPNNPVGGQRAEQPIGQRAGPVSVPQDLAKSVPMQLTQLLGDLPSLVSTFAPIVANLARAFSPFAALASGFAPLAAGTGNTPLAGALAVAPGVTTAVAGVADLVGNIAAQFGGNAGTPAAQNGLAAITGLLTNVATMAAPLLPK